eukprot:COSAG02_NODE_13123_length_1443_cov_1.159226_2_plen_64_part_00
MTALASYEIMRTDCNAKATFMPGSPYEMEAELPAIKDLLDLVHQVSPPQPTLIVDPPGSPRKR